MTKPKPKSDLEQTYTINQVADHCNVTRRTVYDWLKAGHLVGNKVGPKKWQITRAQLDAFIRPHKVWEIRHAEYEKRKQAAAQQLQKPGPAQLELPPDLQPTGSGKIIPAPGRSARDKPRSSSKGRRR